MPSILFILLLALVILGPRKLLQAATNMVPMQHPWEKLTSLMTGAISGATEESGSLQGSNEGSPEHVTAPIEPLPALISRMDSESSWPVP